jgi:hypothetical protein
MFTNQAEIRAIQEKTDANLKEIIEDMKAEREAMEVYPEEMKSVAEHEEVPKEEAAVKPVRALKKQHGDQHLAIACHGQLKKQTQGDGASWKELVTTCREMTRRAIPAWRQGPGRDSVAKVTSKGRLFGKRGQAQPECNNGIRDRGAIWQLHLRKERTTGNGIREQSSRQQLRLESTGNVNKTFRETLGLEIAKRIARSSIRI